MTMLRSLLLDWLLALGRWRLFATLATAAAFGLSHSALLVTPVPPFDLAILNRVHAAIPDALGPLVMRVYQLSGVHVSAVLVLAVLIFLALRRFWADVVCLMVGTGGILLIVDRCLKPAFDRPRPEGSLLQDISGRSFPSGHAAGSVVFYFLTCCLLSAHYPRLRRPLFLMSSIWVGLVWLSTLYVRAHWLTDIAAGAALGYVWLSFCLAGFTVWERHHARRSSSTASSPVANG